jgi:hypothetical protein
MPEKRRRENDKNKNTHDKKHMAYKTFTRPDDGTVWIEARNKVTGKRYFVRIR